jgi:hypothetical protein
LRTICAGLEGDNRTYNRLPDTFFCNFGRFCSPFSSGAVCLCPVNSSVACARPIGHPEFPIKNSGLRLTAFAGNDKITGKLEKRILFPLTSEEI